MIKTFEDFVNEKYIAPEYFWVTLKSRSVDCGNLTEDEFVHFMLNDIKDAADEYESITGGDDISFFDFDVFPNENGISGSCILEPDDDEKKMRSCFRSIKQSKYFDKAKGWEFTYETSDKVRKKYSFRPQIKLILDDNTQREFDKEEKDLADDIARFYSNCRYCGD